MTEQKKNFLSNLQTVLLSLTTAAVLGIFGMVWKINDFVTRQDEINIYQKEHNLNTDNTITVIDGHINNMHNQIDKNTYRIDLLEIKNYKK